MHTATRTDPHDLAAEGALTIRAAADFLGISRSRIYELMAEGELAWARLGRRRVVPRVALRDYLARALADRAA